VPLLDGSRSFCGSDRWVSVSVSAEWRTYRFAPTKANLVYQGDAFVAALPAPEARFYGIDFDLQQLATSGTAGRRFSV